VPAAGAGLPPSVQRGLESICDFDEIAVSKMIPISSSTETTAEMLAKIMRLNSITSEMLLARFFPSSLLGPYCEQRLGKSGKGDAATLAARVAREWSKPGFKEIRAAAAAPAAEAVPGHAEPDTNSDGRRQKRQRST
jgi:hypothetical protein